MILSRDAVFLDLIYFEMNYIVKDQGNLRLETLLRSECNDIPRQMTTQTCQQSVTSCTDLAHTVRAFKN